MPACTAEALWQTVERALACFRNPALWQQLQHNGMQRDWGWDHSAAAYIRLYQQLSKGSAD
jgi:starch synthase